MYRALAPLCSVAAAAFVGDIEIKEDAVTLVSATVCDAPAAMENDPVRNMLLSVIWRVLKNVSHSREMRPVLESKMTLSSGRVIDVKAMVFL
jgi:hypothetical protein